MSIVLIFLPTNVIAEQSAKLIHTSNVYRISYQEKLAEKLTILSGMDNAFFCNSGAEANEAAIKLARLHAHNPKIHEPIIVVMQNSFHGRTMATISASGERVQDGFKPLLGGFKHMPYNNVEALEDYVKVSENIVAIMIEPIQGEGGIRPADIKYLKGLRTIADQSSLILIFDEVQTGMGRTGKLWAHEWAGIQPDVMAVAKGLGGGMPIGAIMATKDAAQGMTPGTHGSTYGGNYLLPPLL